jgi:hypothetical protein
VALTASSSMSIREVESARTALRAFLSSGFLA